MRIVQLLALVISLGVGVWARNEHGQIIEQIRGQSMQDDGSDRPFDDTAYPSCAGHRSCPNRSRPKYVAPTRVTPADVQSNPFMK